jgi:hypothetical protein
MSVREFSDEITNKLTQNSAKASKELAPWIDHAKEQAAAWKAAVADSLRSFEPEWAPAGPKL